MLFNISFSTAIFRKENSFLAKPPAMLRTAASFLCACLIITTAVQAQRSVHLSAYLGSGVSFFAGSGATEKSDYYRNGQSFPNGVDSILNHFGHKPGGDFVAGFQVDHVISTKWKILLSTQYEQNGCRLTSEKLITPSGNSPINGKYTSHNDFISLNPEIGRNFQRSNFGLMLKWGIDYAFKLSRSDEFEYTDNTGKKMVIGHSGDHPEINDLRLTVGASFYLKKWGLALNYKHGLSNYNKNGADNVYSRHLHLKLMYRLFKMNKAG